MVICYDTTVKIAGLIVVNPPCLTPTVTVVGLIVVNSWYLAPMVTIVELMVDDSSIAINDNDEDKFASCYHPDP